MDELKRCRRCKMEKPFAGFGKLYSGKDGLQPICKSCASEWQKNYYRTAIGNARIKARSQLPEVRARNKIASREHYRSLSENKRQSWLTHQKDYREMHKHDPAILAKNKERYAKRREQIKQSPSLLEKRREQSLKWKTNNPEKAKQTRYRWAAANGDRNRKNAYRYRRENERGRMLALKKSLRLRADPPKELVDLYFLLKEKGRNLCSK